MTLRWIGAILVVGGCGGWGIALASAYHTQERLLVRLNRAIQVMNWEVKYRLTPIPDLCRMAAKEVPGELGDVFRDLARELDWNAQPEVSGCMATALRRHPNLPPRVKRLLRQLGRTMGRFDFEGQIQGMESISRECTAMIQDLHRDREVKMRSYRILGLCAGVALVILFL